MFFFASPKKNQKKRPAIEYSPIAGSSYVEQQYIVISTFVILFWKCKLSMRRNLSIYLVLRIFNAEATIVQMPNQGTIRQCNEAILL